jgi:glycerol-3-phosphate dehydrogenase (NAD(P)+)
MRVGILGGGRWGQALARLTMAAGNEPLIAYRDKKEKPPHILSSTQNPPEVSQSCDLLLVATSASEVRQAVRLAEPGPGNRIVVAGRGLEPNTGLWLADVVREECESVRVGALAGPAPVDEILNGALCAGVIASPFAEVRAMVVEALHSKRYRVYESDDLVGIQLAAAAVPVLGCMLGLATNLGGAGVGIHAMVVARGIEENARLVRAMGGLGSSLSGLAGVGDLVAAQGRSGHPNYDAGKALAKGGNLKRLPSVVSIARALVSLAEKHAVEMPLTDALVAISDGTNPLEAVGALMARKAQWETR